MNAQREYLPKEAVPYEDFAESAAEKYLVSALQPQHDHIRVSQLSFLGDMLPVIIIYLVVLSLVYFYGGFSSL